MNGAIFGTKGIWSLEVLSIIECKANELVQVFHICYWQMLDQHLHIPTLRWHPSSQCSSLPHERVNQGFQRLLKLGMLWLLLYKRGSLMKNDSLTHFQQFWLFCTVDINIQYGEIVIYSLFPCHVSNILNVFYCY
jgi:hypothetical protein